MPGIFLAIIFLYIFNKLTCGRTKGARCLVGKTAIVTGGNSGIGFQVSLDLAARGCRVIIANRSGSEEARKEIIKRTNNPNIISKKLDLGSFRSIREFASDILETENRLDILVNNAGVGEAPFATPTEDGLDSIMQINYFGPFLLTHLLLSLLKKSAPSKIIWTSSILAFMGKLDPKTFEYARRSDRFFENLQFYSNTKLATIVASNVFAEKLKGTGVVSNSHHPGLVATSLFQKLKRDGNFVSLLFSYGFAVCCWACGKNVFDGGQTTLHLAASEELEEVSGKFFVDCRSFCTPSQAKDKELCEKIWDISVKRVNM